jgi:hypothetical protein
MNCPRKHGKPSRPDVEYKPDPSKEGNPVFKGGDTHGMEYKQVKGKPVEGGKLDWGK